VDQTTPTSPGDAAAAAPDPVQAPATAPDGDQKAAEASPAGAAEDAQQQGFGSRGRMRRRVRFLRKARELAYRDLGGLVFNLHRFGQRNDPLVLAKLNLLGQIDNELRTLEHALEERQPITVLREAGITACPRCAAIHSSEDHFCPRCGMPMGRHPDLPIAVAGTGPASAPPGPAAPAPAAAAAATPAAALGAADGRAGATPEPHPAVAAPATQRHSTLPPKGPGRTSGPDEITEIIHPPAKEL
jgi:hypothetical protein